MPFVPADESVTNSLKSHVRLQLRELRLRVARKGWTILVVDDNAINRRLMEALLVNAGQTCLLAASGAEALSILAASSVDAVLLDLQMPEMSGHETAARIRAGEAVSGRRLPIIAVTAHSWEQERDKCLVAGMDDFLEKPLNESDLWAALLALA